MAFRFVHTADLHLDSPLRSLALRDPELAALVAGASRQVLGRIVDLCLAEAVDALIIAGDLYDGDATSMKTARFLADQLGRLDAAGVRVFIIRGNHDAASRITRELTLPDAVHVFGARAGVVTLDRPGQRVALHGLSFRDRHAPDSLLPRFGAPLPDAVNIGILHSSLGGAEGHDVYAPVRLSELRGTGFDYWALGHIHRRAVHEGRPLVVMPGIPQGRDMGEAGETSVTLVTVADDGTCSHEARPLAVVEFARCTVDLRRAEGWRDALERLRAAMSAARAPVRADHLVLRLSLMATGALWARLSRDADLLTTEAARIGAAVGNTWIDRVVLDGAAPAPSGGALGELSRIAAADVLASPAFAAEAEALRAALQRALPVDCRNAFDMLEPDLAPRGVAEVLARLTPEGPEG